MRTVRLMLLIAFVALSIATITALSSLGGFLIDKELTETYKDGPYALIGATLLALVVAMGAGLAWAAGEGHPRRRWLLALGACASLLPALLPLLR